MSNSKKHFTKGYLKQHFTGKLKINSSGFYCFYLEIEYTIRNSIVFPFYLLMYIKGMSSRFSESQLWDEDWGTRYLLGINTCEKKREEAEWGRGTRQNVMQVGQSICWPGEEVFRECHPSDFTWWTIKGNTLALLSHQVSLFT